MIDIDPDIKKNFINEIKAMTKLNHKNIVRVLQFEKTTRFYFIIMEYCNGINLDKLIKWRGCLLEHEVHYIMSQIVDAFKCADKNAVIHRDLKPDNIMLHFDDIPE